MTNFCFLTYKYTSPNTGGGELYLENLANELIKKGHQVTICFPVYTGTEKINRFATKLSNETKNTLINKTYENSISLVSFAPNTNKDLRLKSSQYDKFQYFKFRDNIESSKYVFLGYGVQNIKTINDVPVLICDLEFLIHVPASTELKLSFLNLKNNVDINCLDIDRKYKSKYKLTPNLSNMIIKSETIARELIFSIDATEEINLSTKNISLTLEAKNDGRFEPIKYLSYEALIKTENYKKRWAEKTPSILPLRAPGSNKFENWLQKNYDCFDEFVIHGCTFACCLDYSNMLKKLGLNYNTIPHFHPEDKFYFDRGIYDIFNNAKLNFIFNEEQKRTLKEAHLNEVKIINGGGIQTSDKYQIHKSDIRAFNKGHSLPDNFFLWVGRNSGKKQLQQLVEAFCQIKESEAKLVLVSPDKLDSFCGKNNIHIFGYAHPEELEILYTLCKATISVGLSESFGLTIIESYKYGKPVIAWKKTSSYRELVEENKTGVLLDNFSQLPEAIDMIIKKPHLFYSNKELIKISSQYSWEKLCAEFIKAASNQSF